VWENSFPEKEDRHGRDFKRVVINLGNDGVEHKGFGRRDRDVRVLLNGRFRACNCNERSDEQEVVSYCALVVYGCRYARPVLRSSPPHLGEFVFA